MKIGNLVDKALTGLSSRSEGVGSAKNTGKTAASEGAAGKSATVTLSTAANLLAEDTATFDAAKVARIKQYLDLELELEQFTVLSSINEIADNNKPAEEDEGGV